MREDLTKEQVLVIIDFAENPTAERDKELIGEHTSKQQFSLLVMVLVYIDDNGEETMVEHHFFRCAPIISDQSRHLCGIGKAHCKAYEARFMKLWC